MGNKQKRATVKEYSLVIWTFLYLSVYVEIHSNKEKPDKCAVIRSSLDKNMACNDFLILLLVLMSRHFSIPIEYQGSFGFLGHEKELRLLQLSEECRQ